MADIAEVLKRPDVIKAIHFLIKDACLQSGIAEPHAMRVAVGVSERLYQGEKVEQLVAIGQAFRRAGLEEAAAHIDVTDPTEEGNLHDAANHIRALGSGGF